MRFYPERYGCVALRVRPKQLPIGTPGGIAHVGSSSESYTVLHSFANKHDGQVPKATVISVNGVLYGTMYAGGTSARKPPCRALLNVKGTLYGTAFTGGAYGKGTIFKMTLTGTETVLHSFGYGSDGATPLAGLIDVKGTLYGTTSAAERMVMEPCSR